MIIIKRWDSPDSILASGTFLSDILNWYGYGNKSKPDCEMTAKIPFTVFCIRKGAKNSRASSEYSYVSSWISLAGIESDLLHQAHWMNIIILNRFILLRKPPDVIRRGCFCKEAFVSNTRLQSLDSSETHS